MTVITRGSWFPAMLKVPSGDTLRQCFVVAAEGGEESGLWAWQGSPDRLAFRASIDWGKTTIPSSRYARNGVDIWTDQGLVVMTPGGGCRCGPLGRWRGPDWLGTIAI